MIIIAVINVGADYVLEHKSIVQLNSPIGRIVPLR